MIILTLIEMSFLSTSLLVVVVEFLFWYCVAVFSSLYISTNLHSIVDQQECGSQVCTPGGLMWPSKQAVTRLLLLLLLLTFTNSFHVIYRNVSP